MADNDLDKYLEGLGINMGEDEPERRPDPQELEPPPPVPVVGREEGDAAERTEAFLVNLLLNFDPAYAVEARFESDDEVEVEIFGGDPGKIIGKNGRTLAALEYVTNAVLNRSEDGSVRVNIDVGGYKRRRDDRLRAVAEQAIARVRANGEPEELEPMSAAERRVVHMAVADEPDVRSESTGDGRDRRVVILPA